MKKSSSTILSICIFILAMATLAEAQSEIIPLFSKPNRHVKRSANGKLKNARTGNAPIFKDTLDLPFFEDFSQSAAPIDTIYQISGSPYTVKTVGHHGLKNGNKVFLAVYAPNNIILQANYFAKVIDKNNFQLSISPELGNLLLADGIVLDEDFVLWNKVGAKIGPNPDTLKWEDDGGTYITDRISLKPPSLYVATFDALKANGSPYSMTDVAMETDFLTSQPINLTGMTLDSNIVLSFYLAGDGLGEPLNRIDSLYLSFKDKSGNWNYVFGKKGPNFPWTKFTVKVSNSIYFHQSFQFRFQNFNPINGAVQGAFNLDFVYMDKNWNASKDFPIDAAINKRQTSILKNYTAMPYFQFVPEELADSVKFSLRNNSDKITSFGFVQNFTYADGTRSPENKVNVGFPEAQATVNTGWAVDKNLVKINNAPSTIKYEVNALTGDKVQKNRIRFTLNNRDSATVVLNNYYSYDDGTAENNYNIGGPKERLLIKFKLNKIPDTITHVDLFNPQTRLMNQSGARNFRLIIADKDKNLIDASTTDILLEYPSGRDVFTRYALKKPVIVTTNDFFIGYEQRTSISIFLGLDKNTPTSKVFRYPLPVGPWVEKQIDGVLMIRPVLRGKPTVVGVENALANNLECNIYPNPAKLLLSIDGEVNHVQILHITGQEALNVKFSSVAEEKQIDLSELENGMYVVKLYNEHQQATKKLLIAK